ncbi:arylamine N-acetyltransferase [Solibacillus sp. CAU 1738]|uniref:arylamine N-acetyltransferase family protein n=1 Tax=Solibacillus sp. CAU 1738 TaxID=3140363 RepID=UPI0032600F6C
MLSKVNVEKYLNRLGILEIQPPTIDFLFELHRAHVEKISWQTLDIFTRKPVGIDSKQTVELMTNNRSGYCFHLNGAFAALLNKLGFKVSLHRAGVQTSGTCPKIDSFHVGLTVNLQNTNGEDEHYLVDVGLGDMPYEPVHLCPGSYTQGPCIYEVTTSSVDPNGWRLNNDAKASYKGVDYAVETISTIESFQMQHQIYSESENSPWINFLIFKNRHANGSNELKGCMLTRRVNDHIERVEITKQSQWLEVLHSLFYEQLVHYTKLEQHLIWKKVFQEHEVWKKSLETK